MLQTCDIGCCVKKNEGGGLLMLDVARNTGRNMVTCIAWVLCRRRKEEGPDVGCCTQHARNMACNIAR
jgi:hypothetical protein